MRILVDTHVFLWLMSDSRRLKPAAKRLIAEADTVYVSAASMWEISIKVALKKLKADPQDLLGTIAQAGLVELPVTAKHAARVATLPLHPQHNDPFDRLLVAQALTEPMLLLTDDAQLERYGNLVQLI
jgi:PIN domain nuclease of toxin-antitoxin system